MTFVIEVDYFQPEVLTYQLVEVSNGLTADL